MPTPDPSVSGNGREPCGLRGAPGVARRPSAAGRVRALAPLLLAAGVLAAGCAGAPAADPAARERDGARRIAQAAQVAAASLPEGAREAAETGWVASGAEASRVAPPLVATFASIEELAEAVLEGIEAGRGDALWALALTREEFEGVVWPVLPASRAERNTPFDYVWGDLQQKSSSSLRRTLHSHRRRHYELAAVEFHGATRSYGSFQVHRDARLRVVDAEGTRHTLDLFGSIIERDGRFKIFSWVTD